MTIDEEIIHFFHHQSCVMVSTIDKRGCPTSACKGIVEIDALGHVYLLDLYRGNTWKNLKREARMSITAMDEHKFAGYCLKGKARIVTEDEVAHRLIKAWEDRITSRLTQRLLRNIRGEKGHTRHPEALLPHPKYVIAMQVDEIVDLSPQHIKRKLG